MDVYLYFHSFHFISGDEVRVLLDGADDSTPLVAGLPHLYDGFNGFRI